MTGTALVTLLFTDVVASTELASRVGHDASETLRRAHFADLRDALSAHHGHEVKSMGDGLMVSFATCADGVECAVKMQQAAARLSRTYASDFKIRIGLAVGEATSDGGDWYGHPAVEAARLCAAAEPSAILVSRTLVDLLAEPDRYPFEDPRQFHLKGLAEPVEAVELGWSAVAGIGPFPAALTAARAAAFVGCDEPRRAVTDLWADVAHGSRRAVLVAGEPGVGKTRFVAEVAADLHELGASVFYGRCSDGVEMTYQPFAEIADALVHAHEVDPITRAELQPLAAILPRRESDAQVTGEFERFALFNAVETLLAEVSGLGPVVLVLDDLHWATKPTLLLLRHLVRRPDLPLLVVLTYRDNEVRRTHPLAATLADLRRMDGVERVSLTGWSHDEVRRVVAAALETTDDDIDRLALLLHRETEGNPFFVQEVLHHLVETSGMRASVNPALLTRLEDLGIPEGVREVIGRRLDLLSFVANDVLRIAAVVGREFDLDLVEHVARQRDVAVTVVEDDAVLDGIDEAIAARLVVEATGAPGRCAFVHSLVQQTLYDELSPAQRARVHLEVAQSIERSPNADERVLALARHYAAAGGAAALPAADYAIAAADQLCGQAAFEEALTFAEQALQAIDLAEAGRTTDDATALEHAHRRVDLHLAVSHAARMALDVPRSQAAAIAAGDVARAAGCPIALAKAAVAYAAGAAPLGLVDEPTVALCEEALAALPAGELALRSELLASIAAHRAIGGESTPATELAVDAVRLARESGDMETLWSALLAHHVTLYGTPNARTMLDVAEELIELPVPAGRRRAGWMTLNVGPSSRAIPKLVLGDRVGFDADVDEVGRLVTSYAHPLTLVLLAQWRGLQSLMDGDFEAAASHAERLGQLSDGLVNWNLAQAAQILWLAHERGELPLIRPFIEMGVDANPSVAAYAAALAMADAHAGDHDAAVSRAIHLLEKGLRRDYTFGASLYCLGEVAAVSGSRSVATRLEELLEPYAGLMIVVGTGTVCMAAFDRVQGMMATVLGDYDRAEPAFAAALALDVAMASAPLEARTRYWYARMLFARRAAGDEARAHALLEGCAEIAGRIGMTGLATAAAELTVSSGR